MPKDMSSVRYSRLLKVIALMKSKKKVTRAELEEAGKYPLLEPGRQNRMLQRDLQFLREELGAEIEYDYRMNEYVLKHEGSLIVNINASPSEIEALRAGLKIASHFLPHLAKSADSLWEKLSGYIPAVSRNRDRHSLSPQWSQYLLLQSSPKSSSCWSRPRTHTGLCGYVAPLPERMPERGRYHPMTSTFGAARGT